MKKSLLKLWGMPLLLAVLSLFGLIATLTVEGRMDLLFCVVLCIPPAVIFRHYFL